MYEQIPQNVKVKEYFINISRYCFRARKIFIMVATLSGLHDKNLMCTRAAVLI